MKRLFALLLTVCLVAGLLAFPASAAATEGTYGNNLKWRFEEDTGTLTISGTGTATKLPSTVITPIMLKVFHLVIADGITAIDDFAFSKVGVLKSIRLADSVETIGNNAFDNNFYITELYLGKGVKTIGEAAFMEAQKLKILNLPEGVTSIGAECFSTNGLTTVILPASLTKIGDGAFRGCESLTQVYYGGTQAQWEAIEILNNNGRDEDLLNATRHYSHVHTWGAGSAIENPTCAKEGKEICTCTVCGGSKVQSVAKLTEHTWDAGKKNADTTVTYTCTVCSTIKTEGTPVTTQPPKQENPKETTEATVETTVEATVETTVEATVEATVEQTEQTPETGADTNTQPDEEEKEQPRSFPWGLVIAGAAVLLAGGGAAIWFVINKKK